MFLAQNWGKKLINSCHLLKNQPNTKRQLHKAMVKDSRNCSTSSVCINSGKQLLRRNKLNSKQVSKRKIILSTNIAETGYNSESNTLWTWFK